MSLSSWWAKLFTGFKHDVTEESDDLLPRLIITEGADCDEAIARALYMKIPVVDISAIEHSLCDCIDDSVNYAEPNESKFEMGILTTTNIAINPQRLAYLMIKSLFQAGHKEVLLAAPELSDIDTDVLAMDGCFVLSVDF